MRLLFLIMLALMGWPDKTHAQNQRALDETLTEAIQDYHQGRLQDAVSSMTEAYSEHGKYVEPSNRFAYLGNLLDICAGAYNVDCLTKYIEELIEIRALLPRDDIFGRELDSEVGRHIGNYIELTYNRDWMRMWLETFFEPIPENPFSPGSYIQRQVLAATFYQALGQPDQAATARSKAISMIISLRNPSLQSWTIAVALNEMLVQISQSDPSFAYGIYNAAGDFIAKALPDLGPEKLAFRVIEAELLLHSGDYGGSIAAANETLRLISVSELPAYLKDFFRTVTSTHLIVVCAFAGDPECIDTAVKSHPVTPRFSGRQIPTHAFSDQHELQYVASRVIGDLAAGRAPPAFAKPLLSKKIDFIDDPDLRRQNDLYRRAALIAVKFAEKEAIRSTFALEFAADIIEHANLKFNETPDTFPLTGILDKFVIGFAAAALRESSTSVRTAEALMQLSELYNRQLRQADAESLKAIALGTTVEQRRDIQSWHRLNSRLRHEYINELRRIARRAIGQSDGTVDIVSSDSGGNEINVRDFSLRSKYAKLHLTMDGYAERAKLREAFEGSNSLPSLSELQAALDRESAFATTFALPGVLASVCVTDKGGFVSYTDFDVQQAQLDLRILNAALTAGHAPDDVLDSQFPVAAARRYYDLLLKPMEACLKGRTHLVWAADNTIAGLPLGALLRSDPVRAGAGYNLKDADWVAKFLGVSNVLSARAFLAARAINVARVPATGFLGVGDPSLGGVTVEGVTKQQAVLRSAMAGVSGGLGTLQELPETADELRDIASLFGDTAALLLAEKATEGRLRAQAIGEFKYIAFATHGLVREEIPGLTEAALVLTPKSALDSMDDGLLKASEIADLSLNARLVALSACNTANYDFQFFDSEMSGLAAAFSAAGVPATLATLWPVDSITSRTIVAATFNNLRLAADRNVAGALADAKSEFIKSPPSDAHAHPRFWAPFILYGDGGQHQEAEVRDTALPQLIHFSESSGELEVLATDPASGAVYGRGLTDPKNERYQSFVARIEGGSVWTSLNEEVGSGRGLALLTDSVVIDGYVGGGDIPGEAALLWFDKTTGEEKRRQIFPHPQYDTFGIGLASVGADELIFGVIGGRIGDADWNPLLTLRRLDRDGAIVDDADELFEWTADYPSSRLFVLEDSVVVTAAAPYRGVETGSNNLQFDEFDEIKACVKPTKSYLYVFSTNSLSRLRKVETSPYQFNSVVRVGGGRVWGIGSLYQGCSNTPSFVVADLTPVVVGDKEADIVPIFTEPSVGSSEGRYAVVLSDEVVVVGSTNRITGVAAPQNEFDLDDYTAIRVQFEPFEVREGLVIRLTHAGQLLNRRLLVAGSDMVLTSAASSAHGFVVGGMVAGQAAAALLRDSATIQ